MKYALLIPSVLVVCIGLSLGLRAGQLDPPAGPVNSTGRFGPRVDVLSLPSGSTSSFEINQSGSYYLSGNITAAEGDQGIRVEASDVTIDLNGYTITSLGAGGGAGGIFAGGGATDGTLVIRNGKITNFNTGIALGSLVDEIIVEGVHCVDNDQGMNLNDTSARIDNCVCNDNGSNGIRSTGPSVITNCLTLNNATRGIQASERALIRSCTSLGNGTEDLFVINGLVHSCVATTIVAGAGTTVVDTHQP